MNLVTEKLYAPVFAIECVRKRGKTRRMQWKKSYDNHLSLLVSSCNKDWLYISSLMSEKFPNDNFTPKKCHARWKNSINPEFQREYLSDTEELLLIVHHATYKNKWSDIADRFPRRHSNILRNTFYSLVRKLVKQISLERYSNSSIDPLTFIQHLYMSRFLIELLSLAEPPKHKDALAPLYIASEIDVNTCQQYALRCKDRLITSNPSRLVIKKLQECSYEYLANKFFMPLVKRIGRNVSSWPLITANYLMDVIEHVISSSVSHVSPPPTTLVPSKTKTIGWPICQSELVMEMALGIQRALRKTVTPFNMMGLPQIFRTLQYMT
eukprot:TRINITY_DN1325_c0_g1_i10.p1 TRINITY_DN1325_c0_g1~~TRINITY_DN1325_c0_g1_i10.p1  ORF type:complete len:324 (-),score=10.85 TRINITY_DN1325_c0_g1_i10:140-1111(-)